MPRLRVTLAARAAAPFLLAIASGLAVLVSHPPFGWWPTSFLAPALLIAALLVDASRPSPRPRRRAFGLGIVMGAATFGPLLSWLVLPAGFVGWGLLALIQAAWFGLLAVLLRPWVRHTALPIVAAVAWTGVDAWRSIVPFNGFEWGAIAYAHVDGSWMLPVARIVGGRGITFLVVVVSVAGAVAVARAWPVVAQRAGAPVDQALTSTTRWPLGLLVGGLLLSVLATIEPPAEAGELDVLVVQGNDVRHWEEPADPDAPLRIATILRDRTVAAVERDGQPDLTVWPESSIDRDPYAARGAPLATLADDAAAAAGTLLTGVSLDGPDPATQRYVGALLLEDGFDETDRYLKRRLVPFGEYIPARSLFDWFPPLEQVPRDAQPGEGPQAVEVADGVHAAVIVCFETLFTRITRTNMLADDEPAQLLVVVTNDASFGDSAEPAQHLAQTQLRAVETGRWAVHAALSGSSAFVDPHGRTYDETELFAQADIRRQIPLVEGVTPYLVIGDALGMASQVGFLLLAFVAFVTGAQRRLSGREAAG